MIVDLITNLWLGLPLVLNFIYTFTLSTFKPRKYCILVCWILHLWMKLPLLHISLLSLSLSVHLDLLVIRIWHHACHIMFTLVSRIWLLLKLRLSASLNHHRFAVIHLNNILRSLRLQSISLRVLRILMRILHKLSVYWLLINVLNVVILRKLIHLAQLLHLNLMISLFHRRLALNWD